MLKVSIVPDTNVFTSNLDIIQKIFDYEFPMICTINISRTVLDELDAGKTKNMNVRKAIRYIESIALSLKTEIEGRVDERKIDIEIPCEQSIEENSNDDKILNYVLKLENPILLTNDVVFSLRCVSFRIMVIKVSENTAFGIINQILTIFKPDGVDAGQTMNEFGIQYHPYTYNDRIIEQNEWSFEQNPHGYSQQYLEQDALHNSQQFIQNQPSVTNQNGHIQSNQNVNNQDKPENSQVIISIIQKIKADYLKGDLKAKDDIKAAIVQIIYPVIHQILFEEIGSEYLLFIDKNPDLYFYLKLVKGNFVIFKSYLQKDAYNTIEKFINYLKFKNFTEIFNNAEKICSIFTEVKGKRPR